MKRLFSFILLTILCIGGAIAQKTKDVIVMPEFPGGHKALQEFILSEMVYPYEAQMNREIGEVLIGFTVGMDGGISGVRVLRPVSTSLDKEAVRVVSKMPKWKPGTRNGRAVRAELSIPINFAIVKDLLDGDNIETDEKSLKKLNEKKRLKREKKLKKEEKKREKERKKEEKRLKKEASKKEKQE